MYATFRAFAEEVRVRAFHRFVRAPRFNSSSPFREYYSGNNGGYSRCMCPIGACLIEMFPDRPDHGDLACPSYAYFPVSFGLVGDNEQAVRFMHHWDRKIEHGPEVEGREVAALARAMGVSVALSE